MIQQSEPERPLSQSRPKRKQHEVRTISKETMFRPIGFLLPFFIVATFSSTYFLATPTPHVISTTADADIQTDRLLLVNIINRHGDRAPTSLTEPTDRHSEKVDFFWPRGLGMLTSTGRERMYNLGVALRQHYNDMGLLNYDPKSILALSSNITRCRESLDATLEGFYEITSNLERGLLEARKLRLNDTESVPSGIGSSRVWRDIKPDLELVKSLDYGYNMASKYNKNHPSKLRKDLTLDEQISRLPHLDKLRNLIATRYHKNFTISVYGLWSAIQCEMYLERTNETLEYIDHYADWIETPIIDDPRTKETVTLFELFEELVLLSFIGMTDVNSDYLLISPIVNSLIESQSVALGKPTQIERSQQYLGKNLIFYSTHDSIMSILLRDLGVLTLEGATFGERLLAAKAGGQNDFEKLLNGLKMCSFGLSLKFELWSLSNPKSAQAVPVVRLAIYNEPDPYAPKIVWQPVKLGAICRRRHRELYGDDNGQANGTSCDVQLDSDYDCPFETFEQISKPWKLNETRYEQIYNDEL